MFRKYGGVLLFIIFLLVLGSRLYLAFSAPFFASDTAYFNLRQVEHIKENQVPLFNDDLSYSGNFFVFSPLFHYTIAFFSLFMPVVFAAKILPNIFASGMVFLFYLIAFKITKNRGIALFSSFISGFVPVFFASLNDIAVASLAFPLVFLLIYFFLNISKKNFLFWYVLIIVFLSFLSPLVWLFCLGLLFYQLLVIIDGLGIDKAELEISLFSVFFVVWAQFLMYKKLFLFHGVNVIWQNIPSQLLSEHFSSISTLESIYMVGVIPLIYGFYMIFRYLFKEKRRDIYLLIGFALSAGLLLWLRLIDFRIGLMFFGLVLILLFAQYFKLFIFYIGQTRVSRFLPLFLVFVFIAFLLTSVWPSLALAKHNIGSFVGKEEIDALIWIKENTPVNSVIVAPVTDGNLITGVAERRNIIDSYFLLRDDVEDRLSDVESIFASDLEVEVVGLMDKYGAGYIYFSPAVRRKLGVESLSYVSSGSCFKRVYDNGLAAVYHKVESCRLRVVE